MRPSFTIRSTPFFPASKASCLLFFRIGHAQTQRLHVSIELRNRIEQIVHFQHRQGFPLNGLGKRPIPSRVAASNPDPSERLPDVRCRSAARRRVPGKSLKSRQQEWFAADAPGFRFQRRAEEYDRN